MKADLIREKYLKFFESKGHKIVSSDSLVPKDDPTLLFTGAGMNQFKEYFLGIKKDLKCATTSQKCFRTGDIDRVGQTPAHHTFFEMLGNFSFGHYFKKEAIEWAWEFMTTQLLIPQNKLWVSVYKEDAEAYQIWEKNIKLPKSRIVKLGDKDNFWPSEAKAKGPNGPCGPCSEIFFDQGEKSGCGKAGCSPACDCNRFIEVWNLVFTQYNRKEDGVLEPLPMKNIDTGMGLERLAAVMQGVHSNFETDLFIPIVNAIKEEIPGKIENLRFVYTIADHVRASVFLSGDGVLPSNEGRGYVQRMVIRRAVRKARQLGIEKLFLYKLVPIVTKLMVKQYPQLEARRENISQILLREEEKFAQTLQDGMQILENLMSTAKSKKISADAAFKLYDTYGFPLDLTEEIAGEKGFSVDREGFQKAMHTQRESSRKSSAIAGEIFAETIGHKIIKIAPPTKFLGYELSFADAEVLAILKNENVVKEASKGDLVWVIFDKTPFYGESGGQVGDIGKIKGLGSKDKALDIDVVDTKKFDNIIVHVCKIAKGQIKAGDKVSLEVDNQRRLDIAKNHTATHLLHSALRKVLGEHVHQSGSLVSAEKLRFDFTHFKPLTAEQLERVEEIINKNIRDNHKVSVKEMAVKDAVASGAMALFNEKYEDNVRVVSVGDYSKELCGGTHLDNIGKIELFKIISEGSTSAGIRRIEAITGRFAINADKEQKEILKDVSVMLNVSEEDLLEKIQEDQARLKNLETSLSRLRKNISNQQIKSLISKHKDINGVKAVISEIKDADMDILRGMADTIKDKVGSVAILLAAQSQDNVSLLLVFSQDLVKKGFNAGKLIKDISRVVNGGGGGRPDMAQAGGKDPTKLKDAFFKFEQLIASLAATCN